MGAIALVATVAGGCTSGGDKPTSSWSAPASAAGSPPPWTEPADYSYVLSRGCTDALGKYQVTVRGKAVTKSERLDGGAAPVPSDGGAELGPVTGQNGEEIEVPTLGELVAMAGTAAEDGGEVSTTFDTTDGHPVKVSINVSEEGPSGAECWNISDYKPGAAG